MAKKFRQNKKLPTNKSAHDIWTHLLWKLDSSWGRLGVIIAIGMAGFWAGRCYEEVIEGRKHLEYDNQREDYWRGQSVVWQQKLEERNALIYKLREDNFRGCLITSVNATT